MEDELNQERKKVKNLLQIYTISEKKPYLKNMKKQEN